MKPHPGYRFGAWVYLEWFEDDGRLCRVEIPGPHHRSERAQREWAERFFAERARRQDEIYREAVGSPRT